MKFSMAAMRSLTEVKLPRRMAWRVMIEKKISAMFSQDPDVGVKCKVIRGFLASHARWRGTAPGYPMVHVFTYQTIVGGPPASKVGRHGWMEPFAQAISAAKKYVVSSTLEHVDWNAELVRGDLCEAVQQLKREPGRGLLVGGVQLPWR